MVHSLEAGHVFPYPEVRMSHWPWNLASGKASLACSSVFFSPSCQKLMTCNQGGSGRMNRVSANGSNALRA